MQPNPIRDANLQTERIRLDMEVIYAQPGFFNGTDQRCCSAFGCGKLLTPVESLAGDKCLGCQGKKDTRFKHYKI